MVNRLQNGMPPSRLAVDQGRRRKRKNHETSRARCDRDPDDCDRSGGAAGAGLHQFPDHEGSFSRRFGDDHLRRRRPRLLWRALLHSTGSSPSRRHARRLRVGHRGVFGPDRRGAGDLLGGGQHERAPGGDRRDHLRRPRGAPGLRAGGLRQPDVHRARARRHGAWGDPGDRRHRRTVRLCLRRRVLLHLRRERGLDHGDHGQGSGRSRCGVGGAAGARRLHLGPRQPGPDPDLSPGRSRKLPVRRRRDLLCPREGLLQRAGRGLQLRRRLRPARLRRAALLRGPGVVLLRACRGLAERALRLGRR